MGKQAYQQCTRCVMDTSDPEIEFDEEGVCNHCKACLRRWEELKKQKKAGPENLGEIIGKIRKAGRKKKYDVILGISGGVDSCYTAYLLYTLNIRTLLVHLDNGWDSVSAIENIQAVAARFQFDYESYVLDWAEFRAIQLAFLKASVVEAETPTDVAIISILHKVAAKHGVKYIISGTNMISESILPKLWHYNAKDLKYFRYILKMFGACKARRFPTFGYWQEAYYKFIKGIKIIYLLNYVSVTRTEMIRVLDGIGLRNYGTKHHESQYTKFIQSYLLPKKFNLDYRKATLSSEICSGLISRECALQILQCPPYAEQEVEPQKQYIAKKLGLTTEELNNIIALPGKYYYEYPNDEKKLKRIYHLYQRFFADSVK
jgi:N-acetyl sugar amidotransferase